MACVTCGTELSAALDRCPSCGTQSGDTTGLPDVSAASTADWVPAFSATQAETLSATQAATRAGSVAGTATRPTRGSVRPDLDSPLQIGQAFGPRYRVLKLLGIGGMGAVYQAWDEELGMAVALKIIRPDRAEGDRNSERRFKHELVLARQVTHKNVIRIHDLGEVDGIKYITMPYIDGSDLARTIATSGKLSIARVLHVARQIAEGLNAAHDVGVIHRDLKPANILLGPDAALITDFGIAHSLSEAGEVGEGVFGTVRYMAPEQAQGLPVDHRADIYAFGLILFEMATGRGWTAGTDTHEVFYQKIEAIPTAASMLEGELPAAIAAIVTRCVQPNPADRYPSVAELLADLDGLDDNGNPLPRRVVEIPRFVPFVGGTTIARDTAVAVIAMCVIVPIASAVAFFGGSTLTGPVAPLEHEPVPVLVADFENRTGQPVFDGLIEQALGVALEGAPFITAYSRTDARRLAQEIANSDRLDVDHARVLAQREGIKVVLAGSIAAEGSRYRVIVNAVDPVPGTTLSTVTRTAGSRDDILNAVGELGSELRTALGDTTPASARSSERETFTAASVEAASVYWQAQELLNNAKYSDSIPKFRRATELDPTFARAYANWAIAEFYLGRREQAEALFKRTFSLSDRMTEREKYRTYGSYYLTVAQAYDQAIENYEKLVQLYPADRAGHGNLAVAYFYTLNFAKTFEEGRRALDLFPASLKLRTNYALYAMYAGDFATAAREAEQVLKTDPTHYQAYVPLAMAALDRGALAEARGAYERMAAIGGPAASRAATAVADLELHQGRDAVAAEALLPAIAADEKSGNRTGMAAKYIALAESYRGQGRGQEAIVAARRAVATNRHESVLLAAAKVLLSFGREAEVTRLATELETSIGGYSRPYARLLEAELALRRGDTAEAVDHLLDGQKLADLWLSHFMLGQAYVRAERYPEALAAFEMCVKRRGEATAIFLDDVPTFRYLTQLPYWLGRAQEGVGVATQAAESYKRYLTLRPTHNDPLTRDARQRLAKLTS